MWYIYTMKCYSAIKKNTFESVLMREMKMMGLMDYEVPFHASQNGCDPKVYKQ